MSGSRSHASRSDDSGPAATDHAIDDVLMAEESDRTRGFASSAMALSALVAVSLPWLGGDPGARLACAVGVGLIFAVSAWIRFVTRAGRHYKKWMLRTAAWVMTTAILGPEYFVGFFSPITVVLSLGIYYIGQAQAARTAVATSVWAIVGWAGGAALLATGQLADPGLFRMPVGQPRVQAFIIVAVACSLVATLLMAMLARSSMRRAIERSNEAVRIAQRQAAQLAEARNQLARAMRLAVGKAGQHTGQMAGDAQLGVLIGLGAMGEVYEGKDAKGQPVAVKLLHDASRREGTLLERFLREADICRQLDHPNLARVHGAGTMEGGAPYLTMERLVGDDLAGVLRDRGRVGLKQASEMCQGVAAGLEHAHAHGIIHRDLKPHNIFRTEKGRGAARWKILDFGISRRMDSEGTLTQEGVVGTPAYMSPEQARGLPLDARSDVFALAAVVYRALTGQPAFPGGDTPRIMFDVTYRQPQRPSSATRGLTTEVDRVLAIGLAKDPALRFESASALAEAMSTASGGRLDEGLRARADALLRVLPWGAVPGDLEALD